jgi:predicted TIM-barrel fold metal-dependent hydrolase
MAREALVVDGDGHVMEPEDLWTSRMDADRWGDWIPHKETDNETYETIYTGGVIRGGGKELQYQMADAVGMTPKEFYDLLESLRRPGGYDPNARVVDMDADGIDAAVLYPSQAMFFGPNDLIPALHDIDFVTDCIRAYNDWISEYCSAHPTRLFGVAGTPLQDIERAVAEVHRAVGELGLKAVFIRPSAYQLAEDGQELPLNHHVYDPFWAACQELGVPIGLHPATHTDVPNAARKFNLIRQTASISEATKVADDVVGSTAMSIAVGAPVDAIIALGRLLMGGVCERFPDLKFLILESGGGWAASILERMDEEIEANPQESRWLTMRPSEYFRRQCWISFEPNDPTLPRVADLIGEDRIIWASDFPHSDAVYPGSVKALEDTIAPLSDVVKDQIRGGNAVAAYGLDRAGER